MSNAVTDATGERQFTVALPLAAWQTIQAGLGELPMKLSASISLSIERQVSAQFVPPSPAQE